MGCAVGSPLGVALAPGVGRSVVGSAEPSSLDGLSCSAGADVDALDLENRLAELDNDGFQGLERGIVAVTAVEDDPNAEVLI